MKDHEKRSAVRVAYVSEVECEGAGARLIARTADISTSGVFVHSKLCCEAGSILTLRFSVGSTPIETVGEVCYSMPMIGMGVRFLDLKPEYRTAIESLVDGFGAARCEETGTQVRNIMPSGVEPIDRLLGGLTPGHLYLAHGDASGKSLLGMEFIVEGLKRGQKAALIIPYSPEDAVRRFARLGYDCLDDIYNNRLMIFRYPDDIGDQILQLRELAPVLRELESLLAETGPERLVFDPVTKLLAGKDEELTARATEFAVWVRSFGATVLLVASGDRSEAVENLMPLVKESFRFEVRESRDRVTRQIVFEKSPAIPDQGIRVDPSRGLFLLEPHLHTGSSGEEDEMTAAVGLDENGSRIEGDSRGIDRDYADRDPCISDPRSQDSAPAIEITGRQEASLSNTPAVDFFVGPLESKEAEGKMASPNSAAVPSQSAAKDSSAMPAGTFSEMLDELRTFMSDLDPDAVTEQGTQDERSVTSP